MTNTVNNPVKFTQKSLVDNFTRFIRQDWTSRDYEFFDVADFDYNAQPKHCYNEDEMVME